MSRSVPDFLDEITKVLEGCDGAEGRLRQARDDQPLAWALVMAALSWDTVDHRGWRAPVVLCAQARRLMAVWGSPRSWWTTRTGWTRPWSRRCRTQR
ncbi:MAG: hypothetical protein ACRDRE_13750 [Pseudonocardiaceae bacterium]